MTFALAAHEIVVVGSVCTGQRDSQRLRETLSHARTKFLTPRDWLMTPARIRPCVCRLNSRLRGLDVGSDEPTDGRTATDKWAAS